MCDHFRFMRKEIFLFVQKIAQSGEASPRAGLERAESMKGTAHLMQGYMTLSVLCQRFNAWQGALPEFQ